MTPLERYEKESRLEDKLALFMIKAAAVIAILTILGLLAYRLL